MLFYHLPVRLCVLCDPEIGPHDHHHSYPKDDKNWPNAIYNRQRQVETGADYREYWGLHNAIDVVFWNLAKLPPLTETEIERILNEQ